MSERPLKIAYLCDMDPALRWSYSGGNSRIFKALEDHVGEVTFIDNGWGAAEPLRRVLHRLPDCLNLRLRWRAHYALSKIIAKNVNRQLKDGGFDVVFGAYSLHSLAHVAAPEGVPLVFTSDATQSSYRASRVGAGFGSFSRFGRLLDRWVLAQERAVLARTDANLWPSDWQKRRADETYGLATDQSIVLPWGANMEAPAAERLKLDLDFKDGLRLLLVGRDWAAKGGDLAFETVKALRARGVNARLTVIGCTPPDHAKAPFVTTLGRLSKHKPEELARFEAAYSSAHFLMQPSLESYGFAFCEASAFGVPALCLRQGGIPVWDGVNGQALPVGSGASDFADAVQGWMADDTRYKALRQSARSCFEDKLNWAAWGGAVRDHLQELVAQKRGGKP